jgi:hypothetical protein
MTISYCYDEKRKKAKATLLKSQLKKVAVEMGLEPTEYDLRFTAGGIAVWGEATLHSDTIYIQASYGCDLGVLVRSCQGRKDYTGGRNNFLPMTLLLEAPKDFARKAMEVAK